MIKRVLAETEGLEVGALSPNEKWAYRVLQQTKDRLCLRKGVLFRKRNDEGNSIYQLVVPTSHQKRAMSGCHDDVGTCWPGPHPVSSERALLLAWDGQDGDRLCGTVW